MRRTSDSENVDNGARVLAMRVAAETRAGGATAATEALYRLASLRLASASTLDAGADFLRQALDVEPRLEVAERALRGALALHGGHARLLDLYEEVGRHPGRESALCPDALRMRAELPGAPVAAVRAAVAAATRAGDMSLAEALLARFVEGSASADRTSGDLAWGLASLATLREQAGDLQGAIGLKGRAAEMAEPDAARQLRVRGCPDFAPQTASATSIGLPSPMARCTRRSRPIAKHGRRWPPFTAGRATWRSSPR